MKKRLYSYLIFVGALFFSGLHPLLVNAQTGIDKALGGLNTSANKAGLDSNTADIPTTLGKILSLVLGFTGTIFFILVVYAGLMWMTAAGNDERIKTAQGILKAAIIGLVIVLSAYAITQFVGGITSSS